MTPKMKIQPVQFCIPCIISAFCLMRTYLHSYHMHFFMIYIILQQFKVFIIYNCVCVHAQLSRCNVYPYSAQCNKTVVWVDVQQFRFRWKCLCYTKIIAFSLECDAMRLRLANRTQNLILLAFQRLTRICIYSMNGNGLIKLTLP